MTRRVARPQQSKPPLKRLGSGAAVDCVKAARQPVAPRRISRHQFLPNLPDQLPVGRGEIDVLRVYFADLINDVVKSKD